MQSPTQTINNSSHSPPHLAAEAADFWYLTGIQNLATKCWLKYPYFFLKSNSFFKTCKLIPAPKIFLDDHHCIVIDAVTIILYASCQN